MRPNNEILVDFLDRNLQNEEMTRVENQLADDQELADELRYLELVVEAIRLKAISDKVKNVRTSITIDKSFAKPAVLITMYKPVMKLAAALIILLSLTTLYKYFSVTDQSIYNKQFTTYDLTTARGDNDADPQAEAYKNKDWNKVIVLFNKESNRTNKSYFLAAISEMQLNQFPKAIQYLEKILGSNANSGENLYQDEAEYYVALAYLMNHQESKAVDMLDKIKSDKNHTYYPIVSQLSVIDLKIIELKK